MKKIVLEAIRKMKNLVADILAQNIYCVYGNEAKIKENRELFSELIDIESKPEEKEEQHQ